MPSPTFRFRPLGAAVPFTLLGLACGPAAALDRTWIGGNIDWVDGGAATNWSPNDEPDADDRAIFNTANTVSLASNNIVNRLALSAGIDLLTADAIQAGLPPLNPSWSYVTCRAREPWPGIRSSSCGCWLPGCCRDGRRALVRSC